MPGAAVCLSAHGGIRPQALPACSRDKYYPCYTVAVAIRKDDIMNAEKTTTDNKPSKDPQSRKWLVTINYKDGNFPDPKELIEQIEQNTYKYACFSYEIGNEGETPHVHIYIYSETPRRFSTMKTTFPRGHIEKAHGSHEENRDYIAKRGKWANSDKADTIVEGSFTELGTLPKAGETASNNKQRRLLEDIEAGKSTAEIITDDPSYIMKVSRINEAREEILYSDQKNHFRDVTVTYIHGASGTGKTYGIYQRHEAKDICRITDYSSRGLFDAYSGHQVLVFEEFRSEIGISAMLNYLDIYPITLPARYYDRQACFDTVYITSNIPLEQQYKSIQQEQPETWVAFLRRINYVIEYQQDGFTKEYRIIGNKDGKIQYEEYTLFTCENWKGEKNEQGK